MPLTKRIHSNINIYTFLKKPPAIHPSIHPIPSMTSSTSRPVLLFAPRFAIGGERGSGGKGGEGGDVPQSQSQSQTQTQRPRCQLMRSRKPSRWRVLKSTLLEEIPEKMWQNLEKILPDLWAISCLKFLRHPYRTTTRPVPLTGVDALDKAEEATRRRADGSEGLSTLNAELGSLEPLLRLSHMLRDKSVPSAGDVEKNRKAVICSEAVQDERDCSILGSYTIEEYFRKMPLLVAKVLHIKPHTFSEVIDTMLPWEVLTNPRSMCRKMAHMRASIEAKTALSDAEIRACAAATEKQMKIRAAKVNNDKGKEGTNKKTEGSFVGRDIRFVDPSFAAKKTAEWKASSSPAMSSFSWRRADPAEKEEGKKKASPAVITTATTEIRPEPGLDEEKKKKETTEQISHERVRLYLTTERALTNLRQTPRDMADVYKGIDPIHIDYVLDVMSDMKNHMRARRSDNMLLPATSKGRPYVMQWLLHPVTGEDQWKGLTYTTRDMIYRDLCLYISAIKTPWFPFGRNFKMWKDQTAATMKDSPALIYTCLEFMKEVHPVCVRNHPLSQYFNHFPETALRAEKRFDVMGEEFVATLRRRREEEMKQAEAKKQRPQQISGSSASSIHQPAKSSSHARGRTEDSPGSDDDDEYEGTRQREKDDPLYDNRVYKTSLIAPKSDLQGKEGQQEEEDTFRLFQRVCRDVVVNIVYCKVLLLYIATIFSKLCVHRIFARTREGQQKLEKEVDTFSTKIQESMQSVVLILAQFSDQEAAAAEKTGRIAGTLGQQQSSERFFSLRKLKAATSPKEVDALTGILLSTLRLIVIASHRSKIDGMSRGMREGNPYIIEVVSERDITRCLDWVRSAVSSSQIICDAIKSRFREMETVVTPFPMDATASQIETIKTGLVRVAWDETAALVSVAAWRNTKNQKDKEEEKKGSGTSKTKTTDLSHLSLCGKAWWLKTGLSALSSSSSSSSGRKKTTRKDFADTVHTAIDSACLRAARIAMD